MIFSSWDIVLNALIVGTRRLDWLESVESKSGGMIFFEQVMIGRIMQQNDR